MGRLSSLKRQEAAAWQDHQYDYDENGEPLFGWQISKHARWFLPPPKGWRPQPPRIPGNPRNMLGDLWAFGRLVYEEILQLWGSPAELMAKQWLFGRTGWLCRDWVRHLEQLVRCILIIAALTMEVVLPKPRTTLKRRLSATPRRQMNAEDPSTWAVVLHVFPVERESQRRSRARPKFKRRYLETAGLARRIEALYRVLKLQDPYARRLACRLARLKEKNRTANSPRTLTLKPWTYPYNFYGQTSGQHAVQEQMTPAHHAAGHLLAWHDLAPG
jgi:hypothetical protein